MPDQTTSKTKDFKLVPQKKHNANRVNKALLAVILVLVLIIAFLTLSPIGVLKDQLYPSNLNLNQLALITLLKDKKPDIVQVVDPIKVQQDNPESALFYKNAKKDDVLFIYTDLKFAILFRPSTNQVVNVSILNSTGQI